MIFILIKNELIKILKKTKTWIVFGLFLVFLGVCMFGLYNESKYRQNFNSLGYKIEQIKNSIKYTEEQISKIENINEKEYLDTLKQELNEYKEEKAKYENQLNEIENKEENTEQWKVQIAEEIKNQEENLNSKDIPEEDKTWISERIDKLKYLQENNIKPLYGYEFNAYNYMDTVMSILGISILAVGIAIFMSDIVCGEYSPATFKFLLIQPVSRGKILLSKFIASTITALTMIVSGEVIAFLGIGFTSKFDAATYPKSIDTRYFLDMSNISLDQRYPNLIRIADTGKIVSFNELILRAFIFQMLFIITCCAVFLLISTIFKSSSISTAISIVISISGTVIFQVFSFSSKFAHLIFLSYSHVTAVVTGDVAYVYKNVNITPSNGIIVMIATIIISYTIAHIRFNKKEMLI